MAILTLEGTVENGRIRLSDDVTLPEQTKVYVVIPALESGPRAASGVLAWHIGNKRPTSPRKSSRCRLMPSYDASHFAPPAPAALVTLRDPQSGALLSDVLLLLDSGADVTLLPRAAVERLGVSPSAGQRFELIGFDGSKSFAPVAMLQVIFLGRGFRGPYLLIEDECGGIGRDILNHVALLLDGPRQQWSQHSP